MRKHFLTVAVLTMVSGLACANGIVTGPVEPNTQAPTVSGYNSAALGVNTNVAGTNSLALGRDNTVTGNDTTIIGGGNGLVGADQSSIIGYNNYMGAHKEQTIVGANNTTDNQGAVIVGTHSVVRGIDAAVLGNNASAPVQNSVAIGTNSQTEEAIGVKQVMLNGRTHVFAGEAPNSSVSFGAKKSNTYSALDNYTRQLHNVSAGRVDASSLDAVNGSQLFAAYDEIDANGEKINQIDNRVTQNTQNLQNLAVKVDTNYSTMNNTINQTNARARENSTAILENKNAINQNKMVLDNHELRISDLERGMQGQVSALKSDIAKVGAANAALAGLHPLEFNSDDKASYSVSFGHVRNANAVAVGAYYRPNEKTMFGIAYTFGAEQAFNISASFKFGKSSEYVPVSKGEITEMRAELEALKALVRAQG